MKPLKIACYAVIMFMTSSCLETQTSPTLEEISSLAFDIKTEATALINPWSVAELPNGDFLITERGGRLIRVSQGKPIELSGLPDDILVAGQGGLLDIVLAPDFTETSEIYFSYAYGQIDANGTALAKAKLSSTNIEDVEVIFRANPPKSAPQHFGSRIAFLPDDTIIVTLGEGFALREDAQKPNTHLGKLIRLNRDGSAPINNPFIESPEYKAEIYSLGHRNVQGLVFDKATGVIWSHEHGPRGGDELNIIRPGENYGWPIVTKGTDYNGARITPFEEKEGMVEPVYYWVPSIAPSGLAIYRGDMFPEWQGDAIIGGLASRDLRLVNLKGGQAVNEIDLLSDLDKRIRDVRIAKDGSLLVLTDDDENGQLLRVSAK